MEYEKLKDAAKTITMPEEMKRRIVKHCNTKIANKEDTMRTDKHSVLFRKPAVILAVLALLLSLPITVIAAPEVLKGYFRDIKNWQGAVVGTSYEEATDEISMRAVVNDDVLTVQAVFSYPQEIPYRYVERLGIAAYQIVDANGKVIKKGTAESAEIINGQAFVTIRLEDISAGSYKLMVTAFVAEKKADQPLEMNGRWECAFTK